jgi:hypothetical protein
VRRALSVVTLVVGLSAWGESELGAQLPEGSRKVAEHRYKSSADFEGTLKYYKNVYPASSYPRKAVVNQPGVKAVHIPNTSGKGGWEGLNIYEANEEVRIYVVPAEKGGRRPPAKK